MASTKELYGKGFTYLVTRRIIQRRDSTVLRVRVSCFKGLRFSKDQPVWTDFRDFTSLAEGDTQYQKQIKRIEKHIQN